MIVLRRPRKNMAIAHNWALFYYHFYKDHARPNLLWNYKVLCSSLFSSFPFTTLYISS